MKLKEYKDWIGKYGWSLSRSGAGDYTLLNEKGKKVVLFIKINHPGKKDVPRISIKKTEQALREAGLE